MGKFVPHSDDDQSILGKAEYVGIPAGDVVTNDAGERCTAISGIKGWFAVRYEKADGSNTHCASVARWRKWRERT